MTQKLLIDADPGIGDALALLVALTDSSLELLGVTAVSGTVPGVQATRNLHYLIGLADPLRHPRVGQSDVAATVADQLPCGVPAPILLNGRFGLGDAEPNVPDLHNRRESAKLIVDVVREHPQEVRILTLGPLTNLALAFDLDPELPHTIKDLVCLGGAFHAGGDVTAAAEFNIWADPLAARHVLNAAVGKTLVPLDVTQGIVMTFDDIDRVSGLIPSTPIGETITSLLHFAARATRQHLPREGISLPATAALFVAARAGRFTFRQRVVEIETSGTVCTGMTVIDHRPGRPRQSNVDVVTELDGSGVVDYFCRGLRRVAT